MAEPAATDTLEAAALTTHGDERPPRRLRTRLHTPALTGPAAVAAVPLLGLLICVASTRTDILLPETVRPVPPWAGPFRYIGFHLPTGAVIATVLLMFAAYVVAVHHSTRVSTRTVVTAVIALDVIVLLGPPLFSTDVFSYQAYARMFTTFHTNPYTHGPSAIGLDSIYSYIDAKWINTPSVYGPLFTLASGALAGASVPANEIIYKLLAALASLGIVALLWRGARIRGVNQTRAIAVFGLNPLVILYGVGGGHNDLLMLLFATAGLYALLTRRDARGGGAIIVATAIKLTAGVLLPFALVSGNGSEGIGRRRRRLLAGALAAAVIVMVPSLLVFGSGLLHMVHTLKTVQHEGYWQSISGLLLDLIGVTQTQPITTVLAILFAGVCLWLLWRVWRGELDWLLGAGWATAAMLVAAGSLLPWYVAWLYPLVALTTSRRLLYTSLWISGFSALITVINYLPHGVTSL